jgi:hypothetical protein
MEGPLVSERPNIEFERLQFDAFFSRNVRKGHFGKIWLSCFWAKASKFGYFNFYQVVSFGSGIFENV